jgi:hypothetical protein
MGAISGGHESKLFYCGNVLIENRNGLLVDTGVVLCSGTAEREAALEMGADRRRPNRDGGRRQRL